MRLSFMTIYLSDDHQQFVHSLVQGGKYASEDDVIAEALRLLQERHEQAMQADDVLAATRRSLAEADAGLGRPASEMFAEMKQILAETQGR
jgi:putative addiction module CopG family antidote